MTPETIAAVMTTGRILITSRDASNRIVDREWWTRRGGYDWHLTAGYYKECDEHEACAEAQEHDYAPVSDRDMVSYAQSRIVRGGDVTAAIEDEQRETV